MNALYVTMSVPLLLILAGFNHAHGLTTFGKSQNNNQQNQQTSVQGKACTDHSGCQWLNGTSCVKYINDNKLRCLCGNNQLPLNGVCSNTKKAPNHLCSNDDECVQGAECTQSQDGKVKICICTNDPSYLYDCNGAAKGNVISGLALVLTVVCKMFY